MVGREGQGGEAGQLPRGLPSWVFGPPGYGSPTHQHRQMAPVSKVGTSSSKAPPGDNFLAQTQVPFCGLLRGHPCPAVCQGDHRDGPVPHVDNPGTHWPPQVKETTQPYIWVVSGGSVGHSGPDEPDSDKGWGGSLKLCLPKSPWAVQARGSLPTVLVYPGWKAPG